MHNISPSISFCLCWYNAERAPACPWGHGGQHGAQPSPAQTQLSNLPLTFPQLTQVSSPFLHADAFPADICGTVSV